MDALLEFAVVGAPAVYLVTGLLIYHFKPAQRFNRNNPCNSWDFLYVVLLHDI